ncbi:NAD(P)/FAD-dependent oxidoreductase [Quadrisphaera sp. DSM 44207]|uniref:NAD(P)/FAD-dependent oxidoreductase n=1 Tax=Quadrisphaera sp. DSM 44207 TaxID=1881057 RepID=UPI0015A0CBE8|nr:NAD(P)/FAD-dependent oxidoreductase [Quadrisphaera sp. DSM 44207]
MTPPRTESAQTPQTAETAQTAQSAQTPQAAVPRSAVVVGAGYTGLVAALRLAQAGSSVTVLERGDVVGGLASDFTVEGASLERAYHHLFKTDEDIIALAGELGVGEQLRWHDSSVAIYYEGRLHPFATPLDLLRFSPLKPWNRLRAGLVVLYLQKTRAWTRFQRVTAYAWMRRAGGAEVLKVIWEPLLRGKFDQYYDEVAMAWLWARIHIRANSKAPGDSGEKLGYFDGGFQTFTDALVDAAQAAGVKIRTGVDIAAITAAPGGGASVRMADGTAEQADAVVATVPSSVFARLAGEDLRALPGGADYARRLEAIDYLGARLMIFSSDQDLSPYYWHNVNDVDLPFLVFINHTKLVGTAPYGGRHVYYLATYVPHEHELFTCTEDELADRWFEALRQVVPSFDRERVRERHTFAFANAQHIVDTEYAEKRPEHRTPLPGVHLCNFSQIYPEDRGTNYAVRDGQRIADVVLGRTAER